MVFSSAKGLLRDQLCIIDPLTLNKPLALEKQSVKMKSGLDRQKERQRKTGTRPYLV